MGVAHHGDADIAVAAAVQRNQSRAHEIFVRDVSQLHLVELGLLDIFALAVSHTRHVKVVLLGILYVIP